MTKGVPAVSYETRNMPYNILSPITTKVVTGDTILFTKEDIESFYNQSSVLYDFCIRHNINELVVAPLLNKDSLLIGLLVLEYSENNHIGNIDIEELELEARAISTLLEL